MKPKILIVDTYYPAFIKSMGVDLSSTYESELRRALDRSFGTADFYSRNLRALGWGAVDVIANCGALQAMWARGHWEKYRLDLDLTGNAFATTGEIVSQQINQYGPDVLFFQDLSLMVNPDNSRMKPDNCLIAGQLSCPWPGDDIVKRFDILYSSFPHYIPRIEALGVRAIYNPLAFEPSVLAKSDWKAVVQIARADRIERERIHDVVFIGGVGNPSHWRYGMEVLETVAREIPTFKWWGYGLDTLPADSALRSCYQGEAWGLQMYEILLQSKICLNRHGEVAEGYANNMRMFEATGCGALLLTEEAPNLSQLFSDEVITYSSPAEAVEQIKYYLMDHPEREHLAKNGQRRTLRDHTYRQRMKTVSETLLSMLCPA